MTVGWAPAPDAIEERLGTLGIRGKKRSGIQVGPKSYKVFGDPKLSDSFDLYEIKGPDTTNHYHCSCQDHRGGQYRKICSHIAYVVMARKGIVDWAGDYQPPAQESGFHNLPAAPLPLFVDQGQEWTEGVRDTMDQFFGDSPPLPEWVKFIRPHQWDAYTEILWHFDSGKKVVFLSAPTGAGKTLIGEMVRRSHRKDTIYTCTTLTLQNQFERDFSYSKVIKGRSNYRTRNFPNAEWLACDLCQATKRNDSCQYCGSPLTCPYTQAKQSAIMAPLAVANVAYLLSEGNSPWTQFAGRGLVVLDEADAIEDELMRHIEISISPRMQKLLGLSKPEKKTVSDSWQEWVVKEAIPKINIKLRSLQYAEKPKDVRLRQRLERLLSRLDGLTFDDNWVYTGYDAGFINFKPVKVDELAPLSLWNLGTQWLLMSATIISAQQMAEDLGVADDEWAFVDVGSTFPVDNRPIYIEPVANMTAKTEETARPALLKRIKEIIDWHDERVLVHTVSYRLAQYLTENLGERAITYTSSKEREKALEDFKDSANGVLIAPSFERGIDLPYDECRVVIVAKIPFPYLGDKQINKRLYSRGGQGWYAMQTVRTLVQMTGRAMRHEDDSCEIYILDRQFVSNIWKKSKHMLPGWWKDALRMEGSPNLAKVRAGLS
jgi:ATP-dependent DNA helicase DinG